MWNAGAQSRIGGAQAAEYSVRANNTNRMPHLVLCRWSKEYEFTDNSGLRRRIVAGMITNGEEEIRKLEKAVFDEFENESPRR